MDIGDYEKILNIRTTGEQQKSNKIAHYHIYEATDYTVLETLAENFDFSENDHVVDFGCGKGRIAFFLNYFFQCSVTGIEMNRMYHGIARKNLKRYKKKNRDKRGSINFVNCLAEDYAIDSDANIFYFFNPFSVKIFRKVTDNIIHSCTIKPRPVEIILYYPSLDYLYFLNNYTPYIFDKETKVPSFYGTDMRQCLVRYFLNPNPYPAT